MSNLKMNSTYISFVFTASLLSLFFANMLVTRTAMAVPLNTTDRWVVDQNGQRVKLACVNWAAHLETMVVEGLNRQPVDVISAQIKVLGFNCVRLTWATYLFTNESLYRLTVRNSLQRFGLVESIRGIQANNPSILNLRLQDAFKVVVTSLANTKVMVILDNHVSKPGWCCGNDDGNGFFGDRYFNTDDWIKGLSAAAAMFRGIDYVVGVSLRNELRGPRQNEDDWYKYVPKGAEAVNNANPNVIVILPGLDNDTDFSFLLSNPVELPYSLTDKVLFEVHWNSTFEGNWEQDNVNDLCGRITEDIKWYSRYVLRAGYPLFVSTWRWDQRGTIIGENRFLNCFLASAAVADWDWAYWTLVGSYYIRDNIVGYDEKFGILDWNWCGVRNPSFLRRISAIQSPLRGPGYNETTSHKIIFHPLTGQCVLRDLFEDKFVLGPCSSSEAWEYSSRRVISIRGTYICLQANGVSSTPAKQGVLCPQTCNEWAQVSASNYQLSTDLMDGTAVCLDVGFNNTVVTNSCKCLDMDIRCDPTSQWFIPVSSTRIAHKIGPSLPAYSEDPKALRTCSI